MLTLNQFLTGGLYSSARSRPYEVHPDCAFPGCTPAHVGTSVLYFIDGEAQVSPVMFWLHSAEGAVPVTVKGQWDGLHPVDDESVVEFPGDHVIAHGTGHWRSRDEWLRFRATAGD